MAAAKPKPPRQAVNANLDKSVGSTGGAKLQSCAQRIEAAMVQKSQGILTEQKQWDAEALFRKYDAQQTGLLSRGALTELLRDIGLERKLGASFSASARLAFDASSADAHFLTLAEFKQLYHYLSPWHPDLLPNQAKLKIAILKARDLPPADGNGKTDPFVTVMCCKVGKDGKTLEPKLWSKSTTKVIEKTLAPTWGEEFTDKYSYDEGGVKCPSGHTLAQFDVKVSQPCSVCSKMVEEGASMHGCRLCSYDLCDMCKEQGDKEHPGDCLMFHLYDWDKGDRSELLAKAVLPNHEFQRPDGFNALLPMQVVFPDAPRGCMPLLKLRVFVNGMPSLPPRLKVKVLSARGLPPVDLNGKSDPFCTFQLKDRPYSKSQTRVANRTLDPVWNEEYDDKQRYEDGDDLEFEVMDFDKAPNAKYDLLGRVRVPSRMFCVEGGFTGELALIDVPRGSVQQESQKPYAPLLKVSICMTDRYVHLTLQVDGLPFEFGAFLDKPELKADFEAVVKTALCVDKCIKDRFVTLDFTSGENIVKATLIIPLAGYTECRPKLRSPTLGAQMAELIGKREGLFDTTAEEPAPQISVQVLEVEAPPTLEEEKEAEEAAAKEAEEEAAKLKK